MELTIETLIKIILGVLVMVLVISGLFFFSSKTNDFFSNLPGGSNSQDNLNAQETSSANTENQVTEETQVVCEEICNFKLNDWMCFEEECISAENCKFVDNIFNDECVKK